MDLIFGNGHALSAAVIFATVALVAWRHGFSGEYRALIHGLVVLGSAVLVSSGYFQVRANLGRELTFLEEFWISLPILTSFILTDRCVFGRLVRVIKRQRLQKDKA